MTQSSAWLTRALLSLAAILSILACFAVAVEVQERKWGSSTSHRAGVSGAAAQQVQRLRGGKTTLRDQRRAAKHKLKRESAMSTIAKNARKSAGLVDDVGNEHGDGEDGGRKRLNSMSKEDLKARSKQKKKLRKEKGKLIPSTKNRIRSLERTLSRRGDKIPEDVKEEMRAKIGKLQGDYQGVKLAEKERIYAKRYRRVKFFERKKLQRKLAKNSAELGEEGLSSKERKRLEQKRELVLQDLQYVTYFPRDMKYVSVFENPREVVDKLRNSEGFGEKMERARQIVLAYRAAKLKQTGSVGSGGGKEAAAVKRKRDAVRGSDGDEDDDEDEAPRKRSRKSKMEEEDEEVRNEVDKREKKIKKKKRGMRGKEEEEEEEVDVPRRRRLKKAVSSEEDDDEEEKEESDRVAKNRKLRKKAAARDEDETDEDDEDAMSSEPSGISNEADFMDYMKEEQNRYTQEVLAASGDSDDKSESGEEEEGEGSEPRTPSPAERRKGADKDHDDEEEDRLKKGLKGFLHDKEAAKPEVRHRAENCLAPGEGVEEERCSSKGTPGKAGKGTPAKERGLGGICTPVGKGVVENIGFVDMTPGSRHNVLWDEAAGGGDVVMRDVGEEEEEEEEEKQALLDSSDDEEEEGGERDEMDCVREEEPVIEAGFAGSRGQSVRDQAGPGIEKERQEIIRKITEMEKKRAAAEAEEDSEAKEPDRKVDPGGWQKWQKAKRYLRSMTRQAVRDVRKLHVGAANAVAEEEVESWGDDADEQDRNKLDDAVERAVQGSKHELYAEWSKKDLPNLSAGVVEVCRRGNGGVNPLLDRWKEMGLLDGDKREKVDPEVKESALAEGVVEKKRGNDVRKWVDAGSSDDEEEEETESAGGVKEKEEMHDDGREDEDGDEDVRDDGKPRKVQTPAWKALGRSKKASRDLKKAQRASHQEEDWMSGTAQDMLRTPAGTQRPPSSRSARTTPVAAQPVRSADAVGGSPPKGRTLHFASSDDEEEEEEEEMEGGGDWEGGEEGAESDEVINGEVSGEPAKRRSGTKEGSQNLLKSASKALPKAMSVSKLPATPPRSKSRSPPKTPRASEAASKSPRTPPRKEVAEVPSKGGDESLQTPPRVRELLGRIDGFLDQRKARKESGGAAQHAHLHGGGPSNIGLSLGAMGREVLVARAAHSGSTGGLRSAVKRKASPAPLSS